ncbi:MAG TPA: TIGR03619 family F420-dependent LLM class oxidoreductase [Jatrophihabitans sp.]|jgi:probable F420-dependent oxidoreductase
MTAATPPPIELTVPLPCFSVDDPGDWGFVLDRARLLDTVGVDKLAVSDHVVFGERLDEYGRPELGGQSGGKQPTGPDGHWLEPMTLLSVAAGATNRIRLATNILLVALRRPVVLAKSIATLDQLSGGRFDLGVGVGWQREEYDAAGLDFEQRGKLLDECLAVCQTFWTQTRADYSSPYLQFENIHMMPKPLQGGGIPVWVSGRINAAVVRRIARFGIGWIPWGDDAANLPEAVAKLRAALEEAGRDPAGLRVAGHLDVVRRDDKSVDIEATVQNVPELIAAGVTDFRYQQRLPQDNDAVGELLTDLVDAFRSAAGREPRKDDIA